MKRCLALFPILLLFCFSAPAFGDPPTLTLPPKVSGLPGAFLQIPATTTGKQVAWVSLDSGLNLFPVQLLKDTKTAVVSSATPGTYRVLAVTASGDEISQPQICTVVIEGLTPPAPAPTPTPNPQPTPPPAPAPQTKAAWAIVVVDNSNRTPAVGQLVSSPTLIAALQKASVKYRVLDVQDPLVTKLNYGPAVQSVGGAPALILFDSAGKRTKAIALPADEKSFLAAIPVSMAAPLLAEPCVV